MKRSVSIAILSVLTVILVPVAGQAQFGCKDLAGDEKVTYSKPTFIFTVDYPKSMSWVLDLGETKVKFRTKPPGMIGFQFGHSRTPTNVEQFDRSIADWTPAFEFDYGDAKVTVYGNPINQPKMAEYQALLPHKGDFYNFSAGLEWGEMGCEDHDRRIDLEAAIKTLKPNPDSTQ